jgi:glutamine synthetase
MADRHVIYKNGVKEIAWAAGKAITFMAKWREDLAGNSCHIHSSLWREDGARLEPVFADEAAPEFNHWAAGQMMLASAMTYFFAPNINSYKRFQAGSFAPTRTAWSRDNRTAGFRVVGAGAGRRLECRMPGGDCNPYLAFAATIAAGLYGIENKLDPGPLAEGNLYDDVSAPEIPKTLREALVALAECAPLRAAFGDAVIDHYLHAGRWEQTEYDRRVTDWELHRMFERG